MPALSPAELNRIYPEGDKALNAEALDFQLFCSDPWGYGTLNGRKASNGVLEFLADMAQAGDTRYEHWERGFTHARIVADALFRRLEPRYWRIRTGMLVAEFDRGLPPGEVAVTQALIDDIALSRVGTVPGHAEDGYLGDDVRNAYMATLGELGADPVHRFHLLDASFRTVARAVLLGDVQVGSPTYTYKLSDLAPK